jgi:hypothetical protein
VTILGGGAGKMCGWIWIMFFAADSGLGFCVCCFGTIGVSIVLVLSFFLPIILNQKDQ